MPKKHSKIASLAYSDSENEDNDSVEDGEIDDDDEEGEVHDEEDSQLRTTEHNSNSNDSSSRGDRAAAEEPFFEDIYGDQDLTIADYHRSLFGKRPEEVTMPPPTRRRPPEELQRRIERYYEKVRLGSDLNRSIQARKDLRNPSIYEKMISYCQINEMDTNYPKELYDATPYLGAASYYEELSRLQVEMMEKRNQGGAAGAAAAAAAAAASVAGKVPDAGSSEQQNKKSKWDSGPAVAKSAAVAAALSKAQTLASKASQKKPTVVTAFGTINKRK